MIPAVLLCLGPLVQRAPEGVGAPDVAPRAAPVRARDGGTAAQQVVLGVLSGTGGEREALKRAVAALDGEARLALLRILAAGRVSVETGAGRSRALLLGGEASAALLDVVAAQPRATWLDAVDRLDPLWDGPGARVVVLELLARGGVPADLARLERAAALGDQPATPQLRAAARAAFARLLGASADLPVRRLWIDLPGALLAPLLDALEAARPNEALDLLTDCVGVRPAADALALERVERLLDPRVPVERPFLVHEARRCLARSDPSARRYAVRILGSLGDVEALEDLAALLSAADAETALEARASLRRLTGVDLGPQPGAWTEWLAAERAWRSGRGPELAAQLADGSDAEAVAALRELGRHRIDRAWRARTAALALEREPADLLALACGALERFGTRAESALLEALEEHPEERVRDAARRALGAL